MPRAFLVDLPDEAQREQTLRVMLRSEPIEEGFDFALLAAQTEHYSGSDLKELARAASMAPVVDYVRCDGDHGGDGDMDTPCPSCGVRFPPGGKGKDKGGKAGQVTAEHLRRLRTQDLLNARGEVPPTGEVAQEYFARTVRRWPAAASPMHTRPCALPTRSPPHSLCVALWLAAGRVYGRRATHAACQQLLIHWSRLTMRLQAATPISSHFDRWAQRGHEVSPVPIRAHGCRLSY